MLTHGERPAVRVVVTRPEGQSEGLIETLRAAGLRPIELPLLELSALPPPAGADLRAQAAAADLVIAVSPSAVNLGRTWWPEHWPPTCLTAGVGAGTGRAWRASGADRVVVPHGEGDSESLLADPALRDVAGKRIILLRGEGGRDLLGPALRERGALVSEWLCYRRTAPADLAIRLDALLRTPPDAWLVTSSEALAYLEAAWPARCPRDAVLFAPHPRIAAAAHDAGWQVVRCESGDAGLMAALQAWFDGADEERHPH